MPISASVSVDEWESHIDANISSAYVAPTNNSDSEFAKNALNVRGEVSKIASAIGNWDFHMSGSSNLLIGDTPYTTGWDIFEESLQGALNDTQIAFVPALTNDFL